MVGHAADEIQHWPGPGCFWGTVPLLSASIRILPSAYLGWINTLKALYSQPAAPSHWLCEQPVCPTGFTGPLAQAGGFLRGFIHCFPSYPIDRGAGAQAVFSLCFVSFLSVSSVLWERRLLQRRNLFECPTWEKILGSGGCSSYVCLCDCPIASWPISTCLIRLSQPLWLLILLAFYLHTDKGKFNRSISLNELCLELCDCSLDVLGGICRDTDARTYWKYRRGLNECGKPKWDRITKKTKKNTVTDHMMAIIEKISIENE